MEKLIINGGNKINGTVRVSGSKNSVLPILAATLLIPDTCYIYNVPALRDVYTMLELLKYYGADVKTGECISINCSDIQNRPPSAMVRDIRASFLIVGALLGRFGKVSMFMPEAAR